MSLEIIADNGNADHIASNKMWNDVTRWIDSLSGKFKVLKRLAENGECQDFLGLEDELDDAMEQSLPGDNECAILSRVRKFAFDNLDADEFIISTGA